MTKFFAVAVLALAGACSAPSPTSSAIVIPRKTPAAEGSAEAAPAGTLTGVEIRERLDLARKLVREQDYTAAMTVLEGLRRIPLEPLESREAEMLRLDVKQHLLQSIHVDAMTIPDHDRLALGDPLTGELVLVNLSRSKLFIPATASARSGTKGQGGAASSTTLHVDVKYLEYGLDGTMMSERETWNVPVDQDVTIEPGQRQKWPLNLDTLRFNPGTANYRTFTIEAMLYPAELEIGGESYPGNLKFRPKTVQVFPRNYEHLLTDPFGRIQEAVRKDSAPHVPLCAALMPDDRHEQSIAFLLSILGRGNLEPPEPATRLACCVALRVMTGESLSPEPALWVEWGQSRGKRRE